MHNYASDRNATTLYCKIQKTNEYSDLSQSEKESSPFKTSSCPSDDAGIQMAGTVHHNCCLHSAPETDSYSFFYDFLIKRVKNKTLCKRCIYAGMPLHQGSMKPVLSINSL